MNQQDRGFTLIELLTAVGIIGILVAIAIPQYARYRSNGFDAIAQVDLRSVAVAEEAYYSDSAAYVSCNQTTCPLLLPDLQPITTGVLLNISSTGDRFSGSSSHVRGSGKVFSWTN